MKLKIYQQEALNALSSFCINYEKMSGNIEGAFSQTLIELERPLEPYLRAKDSATPYLCIKIPTGGGKTIIAAESFKPVIGDLFQSQNFLVIWLAPSSIIVNQTIEALKDTKHPYRQAIDSAFPDSSINVMDIKDALTITFDIKTELTILVGSMQSFNVGDDDIRKFYRENANYHHFLQNTEYQDNPSLANAIKMCSPYIIVDEAHKARTSLSLSNLLDFNPSFILELTATPKREHNPTAGIYASNILFGATASQLKAENMIKLPIILKMVDHWEKTIIDSKNKRNELDKIALLEQAETGRYIRPIVLFRAEPNRGEDSITYGKIKKYLLKIGIKENEIAISTGDIKDLDNLVDRGCKSIEDENCPIKYIITVDALKEGWDCPFAYILGVVSDLSSSTAVEQLLGRVLRNPYVEPKQNEELSYSYAVVNSKKFKETAESLKGQLIQNGFEKIEAALNIVTSTNTNPKADNIGGLFGVSILHEQQTVEVNSFDIEKVGYKNRDVFSFDTASKKFTILKAPDNPKKLKADLKNAIVDEEEFKAVEKIIDNAVNHTDEQDTRISKNEDFLIPLLTIKNKQGAFEVFEKSHILENISWSEKEFLENAKLTRDEFAIENNEQIDSIDIDEKTKKITINPLKDSLRTFYSNQLVKANIQPMDIIKAINIGENSISPTSIKKFISFVVHDLINERGFSSDDLYIYRIKLKKAIERKIKEINKQSLRKGFEGLFTEFEFATNPDIKLVFDKNIYPASSIDLRSAEFKKHYYPNRVDRLGKVEEYDFAKYIDGLKEVETWVRNIDRQPNYSFWLQTSTDKFYPDFIIRLTNGKIIVAEYKGEDRITSDDSKEKLKLGEVWASLYDNVEFIMPTANNYQELVSEKIKLLLSEELTSVR